MRVVCWLALLLLPTSLSAQSRAVQTNTVLTWEHPAEFHAISRYEATIVSEVGGQAVRRIEPVVPYGSAACQTFAAVRGIAWTSDLLCADLCVAVGETTVTLTASAPDFLPSLPSNEAHETVRKSCGSQPPPKRPPPSPTPTVKLPAWAVGAGAAGIAGSSVLGSGRPPTLAELVNPRCVDWRITGPCLCGFPPSPCVQVEYHEPVALMEIVKQPGTSTLPILGDLLKAGLSALGVSLLGGGGAGNSAGAGNTNLHYSEAHVWRFPQIFGGPCTACAPVNALPILLYASEADTVSWRMTTAPTIMPPPALVPVGAWGPLFPRVGYVMHGSPVVASGLTAFRAMNIAALPITVLPIPEAHIAIQSLAGVSGCLQLAWPKQTPCLLVGTPPAPPLMWDAAATSSNGSYIWISWRKQSCCVPPPGICGIATPPLGLHGENLCPL